MNYLQYEQAYPKTIQMYLEWASEKTEPTLIGFFKHLGFEETICISDGLDHIISINNPIHVNILQNENLFVNHSDFDDISIDVVEDFELIIAGIEILINQNKL